MFFDKPVYLVQFENMKRLTKLHMQSIKVLTCQAFITFEQQLQLAVILKHCTTRYNIASDVVKKKQKYNYIKIVFKHSTYSCYSYSQWCIQSLTEVRVCIQLFFSSQFIHSGLEIQWFNIVDSVEEDPVAKKHNISYFQAIRY